MNTSNNKQVNQQLPKQKRREESIDEDMATPEKKTSSAQHRHIKSSDKKKRMKSDDENDQGNEEGAENEEVNEDEGEDDEDDEEDDDEYDDEEDSSMQSFIVDDDKVDEEEEMEVDEGQQEEKPVHKKKKKKKAERKLDEEDIDLIQENIGFKVNKRKRLQKHSEKERDQNQEDNLQMKDENAVDNQQEEQIDTTNQRRKNFQQRNRSHLFDEIEPHGQKQIFKQPDELEHKLKQKQREKKEDALPDFDGDEIDDQFATKQDKLIAEKDIPERYQTKIPDRLIINFQDDYEEDINRETEFIFNRLVEITNRESLLQHEDFVMKKIKTVLHMIRKDFLDIPMIAKYRKYEYQYELNEDDIWQIFNLELEYGKFQQKKKQMLAFLEKVSAVNPKIIKVYRQDIEQSKNLQQLQNCSPLINYLKQFYNDELERMFADDSKKLPFRGDQVLKLKRAGFDQYAQEIFLDPILFAENLMHNSLIHRPPQNQEILERIYKQENNEQLISQIIKIGALQLAVQPLIRTLFKQHFYNIGHITTTPTDEGKKAIDVFHPSYRVKRINQAKLSSFENDDKFLDIIQNEKRGYISVDITISNDAIYPFIQNLTEKYIPSNSSPEQQKIYIDFLKTLVYNHLMPEISKEIREELTDQAEEQVIQRCQEKYKAALMTGPFSCEEFNKRTEERSTRRKENEDDVFIPDRPRCTVMGVILQQIDQNTSIVTVAIVDKYGELVAHKDLQHLMPPRKFVERSPVGLNDDELQKIKKAKLNHQEEVKEHEQNKDTIKELITAHGVDLIVVGANKLEARMIKKVLSDIAENLKNYGSRNAEEEEKKASKSKRQRDPSEEVKKEAFVIWGSLEIPKLFANCHLSQKLHKNTHPILKQAICLARYEQDPMNEILNLWSFVPSENQALQLNLHPMQKNISQAKLADALEEINIYCANAVGFDINLIIDHDHMLNQLSFLSGIGPRKAKKFIQNLKQYGKKILQRGEIYRQQFIEKVCHLSAIAFLKIRVPREELDVKGNYDILDQTRISPESYMLAHKVARDIIYEGKEVDQYQSYLAVKEVIRNPKKLNVLDLNQYKQELAMTSQQNMIILLEYIVQELEFPFKDPRQYRSPTKLQITNTQLYYMLIDESDRTFRKGIIVTATVVKVTDNIVLCKLDNGLDAVIKKEDLEKTGEKLQDLIQVGHVVTGRIHEIKDQEEMKFGVQLNCKKKDLESHAKYVDEKINVHDDDMINQAFQVEKKSQHSGKYISRRINHPKFKNVSSVKATQELQDKDIGEFYFRPSSRGIDHLTLTWKFYTNNIVHIDILEHDKAVGAAIGSRLSINDDFFADLQEIVERYLVPCNRLLREALSYPKFIQCDTQAELEASLKNEKDGDQSKIPYKITILQDYPQHLVLGYMPKTSLIKEYIKIKPRGYLFHEIIHNPLQNLINWFKENYRNRDYQRILKRQKSPRARMVADSNIAQVNQRYQAQQQKEGEWGGIDNDWRVKAGGNSIHSVNDDNDFQTPYMKSEAIRNSEHGGNERQGGYGRGQGDYNQNKQMQESDSRDQRGRGSNNRNCYNCGEAGHMSKECPNPRQQRPPMGRGRGRGDDGGRDSHRKYDDEERKQDQSNNWNNQPSNSPGPGAWGEVKSAPKSPGGWGATENTGSMDNQAGWGKKTPNRVEDNNFSGGWGENNANDNWGNAGGDNENRSSPARSQRSENDRGRGRGRGGGGRGRGDGPPNRGRGCFKCGQEGHMAKDCTNPDTRPNAGRGGGGRNCFKCNQEGHMARECPNADMQSQRSGDRGGDRGRGRGRGRGQGGGCYKCHQDGHFAKDCPNEPDSNEGRPYKRQRRDDGGSMRRDEGGDWNNKGGEGGNSWANEGGNAWDNQNEGGNAWDNKPSDGNGWGAVNQQQQQQQNDGAWPENPNANNEGGW